MDKYEYQVRSKEIYRLIADQEYEKAVEIADTIDWRNIKNTRTLCTISDLYKINRRYQESKEILLIAYDRHPEGRLIVYSLCELSIKLGEYVQALEYYKEFVHMAPMDTNRYILKYRMYEAQDVNLEERAEVLEEFKSKDYREKWGYELASLYHRMGLASKCVEECEDVIITFGEGKYVMKAMELKQLHEPLSPAAQTKFNSWMAEENGEDAAYIAPGQDTSDIKMTVDSGSIATDDTSEMAPDDEIHVKTVDVDSQYNTTNLQAVLAEGMKELWIPNQDNKEEAEPVHTREILPSTPDDGAIDNTIFAPSPLAGSAYTAEPEPKRVEAPVNVPETVSMSDYRFSGKDSADDSILNEETKRIPTEAVVDYLGAQKLVEELTKEKEHMNSSDAQAEKIPGAITGELNITGNSEYDKMLAQDSDGQISLALPDREKLEKQITGQLSIEDILAEWENTKKENEERRKSEVKERILQHTGSLFDEFDEETKAGLLEQLEKAFRDAIEKEAKAGKKYSEELDKRINAEARRAVAVLDLDGADDKKAEISADEKIKAQEDKKKASEPDETAEIEEMTAEAAEAGTEPESGEVSETEAESEMPVAEEEKSEPEAAPDETESDDNEEVKAVIKALADDDEDEKSDKGSLLSDNDTSDDGPDGRKRSLTEEESEFFAPFLTHKSTKRQITEALDNISLASYTGNLIITGEEGAGALDLTKRLIKHLQTEDSNFVGQIAKISGKALNNKDIALTLDQFKNGALIIDSARGMKKSSVEKLMKSLEREDLGILVILEDTSEGMDRIVKALPNLTKLFNIRIDLQALDDKALVSYAREYALSQEYSIDEFGILALHTRISEMQTVDHQVTVAEVRDLVDDAIYFAEKKTPKHLFDVVLHKRYDNEDMVILREKDFMHY